MYHVSFRITSPVCICIYICMQAITMVMLICDGDPQILGCSCLQAFVRRLGLRARCAIHRAAGLTNECSA